jgi:hypothetical protein
MPFASRRERALVPFFFLQIKENKQKEEEQ